MEGTKNACKYGRSALTQKVPLLRQDLHVERWPEPTHQGETPKQGKNKLMILNKSSFCLFYFVIIQDMYPQTLYYIFYCTFVFKVLNPAAMLTCDECGEFESRSSAEMISHKKKHGPGEQFSCDHCDYKCKHKKSLTSHKLKQHGDGKDLHRDASLVVSSFTIKARQVHFVSKMSCFYSVASNQSCRS